MAAIRLETFGGLLPKVSDRLLPKNNASIARNSQLYSGELRGLRTPKLLASFPGNAINRVFRLANDNNTWAVFEETDVNFVKAPLVNDSFNRYYWSGGNAPPQFDTEANIVLGEFLPLDGLGIALGVPAPTTAPVVAPPALSPPDDETRAYVYTYVNSYGEESAPSPPSAPATGDIAGTWALSGIVTSFSVSPPVGGYQWDTLTKIRIYRTVTGTSSIDYRFVAEDTLPLSTFYNDNVSSDAVSLNEPISTVGFFPPPHDVPNGNNLEGLVVLPNGIMAGFTGRDIYMSEPYHPHAWPTEYITSVDFDIVGLGVYQSGLIVCTVANPYVISGAHPLNMTMVKMDDIEPCLSFRSIVSATDGVFYASQNGLIQVTEYGAGNITRNLMHRNEWRSNYSPDSVYGALLGMSYIAFYTVARGFVIDRGNELANLYDLTNFSGIQAIQTDPFSGEVYFIRNNQVFIWNPENTSPLYYVWKSKEFEAPKPVNFGAFKLKFVATVDTVEDPYEPAFDYFAYNSARIGERPPGGGTAIVPLDTFNARSMNMVTKMYAVGTPTDSFGAPYPVPPPDQNRSPLGGPVLRSDQGAAVFTDGAQIKIWAQRKLVYTGLITDEEQHRLPSGFKADIWQIEIQSAANIYSFTMAETGKELATT